MIKTEQTIALEKAIYSFEDFIKNADHSNPATLSLIIDDDLSENESEIISTVVQDFESFELLNNEEVVILSTDQLNLMLSDLKYHLDTQVERNAADEINNEGEIFSKDF